MKKIYAVAITMLMLIAGVVSAQQIEQHATIKKEEVPAAVLQKFEKEFGAIPDGGTWTVTFVTADTGSVLRNRPTLYTFKKRTKAEKITVSFAPEGEVRYVKGLELGAYNG